MEWNRKINENSVRPDETSWNPENDWHYGFYSLFNWFHVVERQKPIGTRLEAGLHELFKLFSCNERLCYFFYHFIHLHCFTQFYVVGWCFVGIMWELSCWSTKPFSLWWISIEKYLWCFSFTTPSLRLGPGLIHCCILIVPSFRWIDEVGPGLIGANGRRGRRSFIFLQLYYSPLTSSNVTGKEAHHGTGADGGAWPILVPANNQTAIKNLDRIPSYETHKIGVIYVGRGQAGREAEILSNEHGSVRYMEFLHRLGRLVSLDEVDTRGTYIGGLEVNGEDGKFAYMWKDDVLQVRRALYTSLPWFSLLIHSESIVLDSTFLDENLVLIDDCGAITNGNEQQLCRNESQRPVGTWWKRRVLDSLDWACSSHWHGGCRRCAGDIPRGDADAHQGDGSGVHQQEAPHRQRLRDDRVQRQRRRVRAEHDPRPVQPRVRRRRAAGPRHAPRHPQVPRRPARPDGRPRRAQARLGPQRRSAQPPDGLPRQRNPIWLFIFLSTRNRLTLVVARTCAGAFTFYWTKFFWGFLSPLVVMGKPLWPTLLCGPTVGGADSAVQAQLPVRVQLAGTVAPDQTHQGPSGEGGGRQGEGEGEVPVAAAQPVVDARLHRTDVSQSQRMRRVASLAKNPRLHAHPPLSSLFIFSTRRILEGIPDLPRNPWTSGKGIASRNPRGIHLCANEIKCFLRSGGSWLHTQKKEKKRQKEKREREITARQVDFPGSGFLIPDESSRCLGLGVSLFHLPADVAGWKTPMWILSGYLVVPYFSVESLFDSTLIFHLKPLPPPCPLPAPTPFLPPSIDFFGVATRFMFFPFFRWIWCVLLLFFFVIDAVRPPMCYRVFMSLPAVF